MATDKDRDKRATREGITEGLSESGLLHDVVEDTFDELNEGAKFVKTKQATREGLREGLSGQTVAGDAVRDTVDEIAHGRAHVKQKEYFREVGREIRKSRDGGGGARGGLLASFTRATGVPWPAFVILVIVGGFLGWRNLKRDYSKPFDAAAGTPAAVSVSTGSGPTATTAPLQIGNVATCSAVRAWRDYTAKSDFQPGEQLLVYTEAIDVNQGGKMNLTFDEAIVAPSGATILAGRLPISIASTADPSYAAWQSFRLPSDAPPGAYTATVLIRNNLTGGTATQSVRFSVSSLVGTVATASAVRAWGDYTAQSEFFPGSEVLVYAEALNVNHGGKMDVAFSNAILAPDGTTIAAAELPIFIASTADPSYAAYQSFRLPSDARSGLYTATVLIRDNQTGFTGTKSIALTVTSAPTATEVNRTATSCYNGEWRENEVNDFTWRFDQRANTLRIVRNDGFVSGTFQKSAEGWTGFLNWGNGTRWDGVVLHDVNADCTEITTNQRWWYRR